ncbi:MAG TPA: NADH-quinone oxidoreductase subunit L [Aggregatilinea sp.]|uniref:NADH-quinone oxidoreductase subunit L n=1 Tax=Aggregatilinea sp. TaxID=2806333 RepID=UPI002CC6B793|nr:NADH-quinone oxidoreductase subunit L [Aggregatilinea sp.]HML20010.1 NADH-quinone oxidoreductase subunit L [Aggregatilinea sp.]
MENFFDLVPLIILFPLVGMVINLFTGKHLGERGVAIVAVGASGLAFLIAVLLWIAQVDTGYGAAVVNMPLLGSWIKIPSENIDFLWQFRVDTLSVTMMLVVTGVGTLIHIYAIGYMHGDERFPRFFVYLNLFLVFMLILVTGNSYLVLFVGWEGVGLCSFLLIGFWFDKPNGEGWKNSNAARKAFIANRVGDWGLLMGIFLVFWTFGSLTFYEKGEAPLVHHTEAAAEAEGEAVFEAEVPEEPHETTAMGVFNQASHWLEEGDHEVNFGVFSMSLKTTLTLITLFFLLGATGKSAQIPLFVWLPDAMAGPTPVSALIHAATMVTAGVYMMVRSNVFYHAAETTSFIVTIIGTATALVAGFIALGQWDIKKVLAYSTVSQLGFMVAAVGVGAYAAAMFHLVTHAFFKALLFLGSGSVIHGMEHGHHHLHEHGHGHHDEEPFDAQDMRNMGGLRNRMPVTFWTYLAATLAIAGIFPFAGFWSKDEILADALKLGTDEGRLDGYIAFAGLLIAAAFTAFYMWRQVRLVFFGKARHEAAEHAPESALTMIAPLAVLGFFSVVIGFINVPSNVPILSDIFGSHQFTSWLEHAVTYAHAGNLVWLLAGIALLVAGAAIYLAQLIYNDRTLDRVPPDPLEANPRTAPAFALSNARLYWDEAYYKYIVFPFRDAAWWLAGKLDWSFWHDFVHEVLIYRSFQTATRVLSQPIDRGIIDRSFNSIGGGVQMASNRLRRIQTGFVRTYALSVLFGALLVIVIILFPVIRDLLGM